MAFFSTEASYINAEGFLEQQHKPHYIAPRPRPYNMANRYWGNRKWKRNWNWRSRQMAEVMRTKHEQQQKQQEQKPTPQKRLRYSPYRAGYGAFSGR